MLDARPCDPLHLGPEGCPCAGRGAGPTTARQRLRRRGEHEPCLAASEDALGARLLPTTAEIAEMLPRSAGANAVTWDEIEPRLTDVVDRHPGPDDQRTAKDALDYATNRKPG